MCAACELGMWWGLDEPEPAPKPKRRRKSATPEALACDTPDASAPKKPRRKRAVPSPGLPAESIARD